MFKYKISFLIIFLVSFSFTQAFNWKQQYIQTKITAFLQQQLEKWERENSQALKQGQKGALLEKEAREEVIQKMKNSEGVCAGLSTLWVYGQKIQNEPKRAPGKERDDANFFESVMKLLSEWNTADPLTPQQQHDIERFIGNILLYQDVTNNLFYAEEDLEDDLNQLGLNVSLEDSRRGRPVQIFSTKNRKLSKQALLTRLKQIIHPKLMVILGFGIDRKGGHAMAVYRDSELSPIGFYDPNSEDGPVELNSFKELVASYWDCSQPGRFRRGFGFHPMDDYLRKINMRVFAFESDEPEKYVFPDVYELDWSPEEVKEFVTDFGNVELIEFEARTDPFLRRLLDKIKPEKKDFQREFPGIFLPEGEAAVVVTDEADGVLDQVVWQPEEAPVPQLEVLEVQSPAQRTLAELEAEYYRLMEVSDEADKASDDYLERYGRYNMALRRKKIEAYEAYKKAKKDFLIRRNAERHT